MKKTFLLLALLLSTSLLKAQTEKHAPVMLSYETAAGRVLFDKCQVIGAFNHFSYAPAYRQLTSSQQECYEDAIRYLNRSRVTIFLSENTTSFDSPALRHLTQLLKNNLLPYLTPVASHKLTSSMN